MISRCRSLIASRAALLFVTGAFMLLASCGDDRPRDPEPAPTPPPTATAPSAAKPSAKSGRPRIVCFGDSLTAGPGLPPGADYPSILQRQIDERGYVYEVVNAGVSGDTTAGGLRRIDRVLTGGAEVVVLELGANDGLRGLAVSDMEKNLVAMVRKAKESGAEVLLAGMEAPPNYGPDYTAEYRRAFAAISEREKVPLIPFFLEGVAGRPEFNLQDGIHPNEEGARLVAETVWTYLEPMID